MQASEKTLNEIKAKISHIEIRKDNNISTVYVRKELLFSTLKTIKEGFGFKLFIDHSVIDTMETQERFEAFYILYNIDMKERLTIKTKTQTTLPSIEKLWFAAKWAERECYDMFGINYEGHEHLVRAFMWDTYSYYPLRKDFPLQGYEIMELPSLNETVFNDTLLGTMNYKRTHTYVPTLKDLEYTEKNRLKKKAQVVLNWGPLHPGTHGTMWFLFDLEGERVVQTDVILGQLHRGVEKIAEHQPYQQFLVYTDRMDYISGLCSNQAWTIAVERLLGIENLVPIKAKYIRTMMSELQRINSHLLWLGTYALDLGALTIFLYAFKEREKLMDIIEGVTGARLTISYTRIGGVRMDIPNGALDLIENFTKFFPKELKDWEKILSRNRIWLKRNKDVGVLTKDDIYFYGLTGAVARGSGVFYDIRKLEPYDAYNIVDFDVPLGENGDCYDRYLVRTEEMRQSIRIIEQCVQKLKTMSVNEPFMAESSDPKKLKLTLDGIGLKVPAGEIYSSGENPRGELGFYINSKGGLKPYRVKIRPGSFYNLCVYPHLMENRYVADAVTILASLDPVVGEVDR